MKPLTAWVMGLLAIAFIITTANAAQFIPLGNDSRANGVSGDGSVAVGSGHSPTVATVWMANGDEISLGVPGSAYAASLDGSVVVGTSPLQDEIWEAFLWTETGGIQGIGILPGMTLSEAEDVSANGSIVVGSNFDDSGGGGPLPQEAFRWTEGVGMESLGIMPGYERSYAGGISGDGSIIVGQSSKFDGISGEAFRWTEGTGMVGLGNLPGGLSVAQGISADGSTIVGSSWNRDISQNQAIRWTESTGIVGLGMLPGHTDSAAFAVSGDGGVVVGESEDDGSSQSDEAFIWDETNGMRRLVDVLTGAGLDMTGWRLRRASGVSDDGNVIVGNGVNLLGQTEAWIARLDSTTNPDFNSDGILDCIDIDALVAEIASGTHGPAFDLTGDGLVDIADLDEWRAQGGAANLPSGNPYLEGDANLDGFVAGRDFLEWNNHKFTSTAAWCSGDFNADGTVDDQDFVLMIISSCHLTA